MKCCLGKAGAVATSTPVGGGVPNGVGYTFITSATSLMEGSIPLRILSCAVVRTMRRCTGPRLAGALPDATLPARALSLVSKEPTDDNKPSETEH